MLIDHKHKFIFVHIPKTGGASFRKYHKKRLASRLLKKHQELLNAHSPISREICEKYSDYYKFSIVRNTWEVIASSLRFINSHKNRSKDKLHNKSHYTLDEWLEICREPNHISEVGPFPCQLDYLRNGKEILVDYICKLETLEEDLTRVLSDIGLQFDRSIWNQCRNHYYGHYDWKELYQKSEIIEKIEKLCQDDLEYFGWTHSLKRD